MADAPAKVYGSTAREEFREAALRRAARVGCDNLLRAQLRAGQHLLSHALAIKLGSTLGMVSSDVRAASGDPTIKASV